MGIHFFENVAFEKKIAYNYSRMPIDMDGTLTLIFGKSETSGGIKAIILPFVYF